MNTFTGIDKTDCKSEEGITVSLIDTIGFLCGLLSARDLSTPAAKEALEDLRTNQKYNDMEKIMKELLP